MKKSFFVINFLLRKNALTLYIMNLKPNKSPGLDGLTNEFYKTFWNDLKMLFYDMLKQMFDEKRNEFFTTFGCDVSYFKKKKVTHYY